MTARRDIRWIVLAGCGCTIAYLYLALQSRAYGDASVADLLSTSAFVILITAAVRLRYRDQELITATTLIVGFGLLFRLIGVFTFPVLEDDFYRYLWDGMQTVNGSSPYLRAPAEFFGDDTLASPAEALLDAINYPELATAYGPTAQWLFALGHLLDPYSSGFLQWTMAVADAAILLLFARTARPLWVLCYAWSPLLIKEFAMTAHIDVLGALLLVLALVACKHQQWLRVGALTALACGVKPFALIAAPFLIGWQWRGWLAFGAVAALIAWPFGIADAWLPEGAKAMSSNWYFNAPLHHLAGGLFGAQGLALATPVLLGLFGLTWLTCLGRWYYRWHTQGQPDTAASPLAWLFGLFLLLLPAVNPWYLIWWLPFVASRPWITPWVAGAMVLLSYLSGINLAGADLGLYQLPGWVLAVEFGVILSALLFDVRRYASPSFRR